MHAQPQAIQSAKNSPGLFLLLHGYPAYSCSCNPGPQKCWPAHQELQARGAAYLPRSLIAKPLGCFSWGSSRSGDTGQGGEEGPRNEATGAVDGMGQSWTTPNTGKPFKG